MTTDHQPIREEDNRKRADTHRRGEGGFSLTELLAVVNILGLLASMMVPHMLGYIQKAWLARCHAELKGIQTGIYLVTTPGVVFPSADDFWGTVYPGALPGNYYYLVDNDDPNNGHGNELDGYDEGNPGGKPPPDDYVNLEWVIVCDHNHGLLARYCYITDHGIPTTVTHDGIDPGYQKFYEKGTGKNPGGNGGGNGGGKGGGKK